MVPDLFQAEPSIDQSTGAGVPKCMRSTALPRPCHRQKTAAHKVVKTAGRQGSERDRKSTRLNSSHGYISYAVFCLKKKKKTTRRTSSTWVSWRSLVREQ